MIEQAESIITSKERQATPSKGPGGTFFFKSFRFITDRTNNAISGAVLGPFDLFYMVRVDGVVYGNTVIA